MIPGSGRSTREGIGYLLQYSQASLLAQLVKTSSTMGGTWAPSLGWKDPLEQGTATHSSILTWRIPWASQVALVVKNLFASVGNIRDSDLIPGLGRSPGGGMTTHSSILAWEIPWTEESGGLQSLGSQRVRHD